MTHAQPPKYLAQQLVRLQHAKFDMQSAKALAHALAAQPQGSIDPLPYGLLTGLVVSYARPFVESREYGRIGSKFSKFRDRPDLKERHERLLELRMKLLAHTDETPHRRVGVFTRGAMFDDRPAVFEGRSGINVPSTPDVIELLEFQEARLGDAIDELARRLQEIGYWPENVMLELDASGNSTLLDREQEKFIGTTGTNEPAGDDS
jgi:hypothetical protein